MKRFMTVFCAALVSGAALSAQEADTTAAQTAATSKTDTIVVIVKHEYPEHDTTVHHVFSDAANRLFEKTGKPVKKGYKAVEKAFVDGYQAVEDAFVTPFTDTVSTSRMYRRHYRADIELEWANPMFWGITSSHGFSFGNGLYVGGGAGFTADFTAKDDSEPTFLVPVFADIKYSMVDMLGSPFVSLRAGGYADVTNSGLRTFVNPAIGVDIGRFSIKVGYEYQLGFYGYGNGEDRHRVKCGLGFTF